jgi:hypothetical protein
MRHNPMQTVWALIEEAARKAKEMTQITELRREVQLGLEDARVERFSRKSVNDITASVLQEDAAKLDEHRTGRDER